MNHLPPARPWLVTGASGFLGRHLLQALDTASPSRRIIALVRSEASWSAADWTGSLERVDSLVGSFSDSEAWWGDPRLDDLGGIFHLAALVRHSRHDADEVYRVNVEGTKAMVRLAAERGCRLVFVSTSGTVGCFDRPGVRVDEDAPYCEAAVRRWPYYHSKILAERAARDVADALGVDLVIVRPPVLLGPGDHRLRSTATLIRFLRGKLPFVVAGGMHFTDIRDVAQALVRIAEIPSPRPVYHLPGVMCTIQEFFAEAAEVARATTDARRPSPRAPVVLPYRLAWSLAMLNDRLGRTVRGKPFGLLPDPSLVEMASRHWSMESRYAEQELDYRPRPGRETLVDTIEWLYSAVLSPSPWSDIGSSSAGPLG